MKLRVVQFFMKFTSKKFTFVFVLHRARSHRSCFVSKATKGIPIVQKYTVHLGTHLKQVELSLYIRELHLYDIYITKIIRNITFFYIKCNLFT